MCIGGRASRSYLDATEPVYVAALGKSVASVDGGEGHTCASDVSDGLWCWGSNYYGQLGDGSYDDHPSPSLTALACERRPR